MMFRGMTFEKSLRAFPTDRASQDKHGVTGETLEDVLLDLAKWGRPRVSMPSGTGWYSCIDVQITPTGAKFEVASEFGMATPLAAALQCRERLMASVKAIGGVA